MLWLQYFSLTGSGVVSWDGVVDSFPSAVVVSTVEDTLAVVELSKVVEEKVVSTVEDTNVVEAKVVSTVEDMPVVVEPSVVVEATVVSTWHTPQVFSQCAIIFCLSHLSIFDWHHSSPFASTHWKKLDD